MNLLFDSSVLMIEDRGWRVGSQISEVKMMSLIQLAEKRWLPDPVIRYGMRRLLRERLEQEKSLAAGGYDRGAGSIR